MLRDYEIIRNDKLLATLKLLISAIALYIIMHTVPSFVELLEDQRPSYTEDLLVRVIANSNTVKDQEVKQQVAHDVNQLMKQSTVATLEKNELMQHIQLHMEKNYAHLDIQMKHGDNLIPPKRIMQTFYPQHAKDSLVIIIGNGRGENWFCSAFPNVCEDEEQPEKEKVRFKLIEWLKKKMA
ncbi:stage II sporulation protein R [Lysinibacillus sp. LZ02]|uniref:stage II sporulation protein R n=1 Tax=Lysinibacillus sp. LZ02 TaxID=3420668 RepID=UPI003D359F60